MLGCESTADWGSLEGRSDGGGVLRGSSEAAAPTEVEYLLATDASGQGQG